MVSEPSETDVELDEGRGGALEDGVAGALPAEDVTEGLITRRVGLLSSE